MHKTHTTAAGLILLAALGLTLPGCGESGVGGEQARAGDAHAHDDHDADHHMDHDDHDHMGHDDHDHGDEVALDPITIDGLTIELAQGHGAVAPGKEGHLVVKLPYTDRGETVVRAWIGGTDRTYSYVGKGEYARSHDDYEIHAIAPDPLPEDAMWWIEIEKPDGATLLGAAKPIRE